MGRCKANGHHAVEGKVGESKKHEQQIEEKFACNREFYSRQCISISCHVIKKEHQNWQTLSTQPIITQRDTMKKSEVLRFDGLGTFVRKYRREKGNRLKRQTH